MKLGSFYLIRKQAQHSIQAPTLCSSTQALICLCPGWGEDTAWSGKCNSVPTSLHPVSFVGSRQLLNFQAWRLLQQAQHGVGGAWIHSYPLTLLPTSLSPSESCRPHGNARHTGSGQCLVAEAGSWHLTVRGPKTTSSWLTDFKEGMCKGWCLSPTRLRRRRASRP